MPHKNKAGFTLVEMLVVTSIISLLSSVVLSTVNTTRQKATNKQTLSVANEYRNAIELYRANDLNGGLPNPGDEGTYYCLGDYPSTNTCGWGSGAPSGNATENTALQSALSPYLPTLPTAKQSDTFEILGFGEWYFNGPTYACNTILNGICTKSTMEWVYGNDDPTCLGGNLGGGGSGICTYVFE